MANHQQRRKPGRPPLDPPEFSEISLSVRLPPDLNDIAEQLARMNGVRRATVLRDILLLRLVEMAEARPKPSA